MGIQLSGEVLHIAVARREVGEGRDYATCAFDLGLKQWMELLQLEQGKGKHFKRREKWGLGVGYGS